MRGAKSPPRVQSNRILKLFERFKIRTAGRKYFFDTLHFLNQVDEADLLQRMEDGQTEEPPVCNCTEKCVAGSVNTACPICNTNMSACAGKEAEPEPEETEQPQEEEKGGGNCAVMPCIHCGFAPF